jgi:hypothetical protein
VIADSGFHRGRNAERLMNTAEVAVHEAQGNRATVVFGSGAV